MSKKFVRVPVSITLEGSVLVELQEGESLETLSTTELEERALNNFDDNDDEFYSVAEETNIGADGKYAWYVDDDDEEGDEEDDFDDDFWNECLEDDEEGEE